MKDFAKSIVCNTKVGNGITKFGMGTYVIADGHKAVVLGETVERGPNGIPFGWVTIRWVEGPWKGQNDQQYDYDLKKAGNTKTGNVAADITTDGNTWFVTTSDGKKKEFPSEREAEAYVKKIKAINSRVGNRDIHMSSSNSGELWLSDNGEGSMYDPIELGRYDFSGKSEAMSVVRDLEQLKRKAEQKVKDADKFINAIKQWASGLK